MLSEKLDRTGKGKGKQEGDCVDTVSARFSHCPGGSVCLLSGFTKPCEEFTVGCCVLDGEAVGKSCVCVERRLFILQPSMLCCSLSSLNIHVNLIYYHFKCDMAYSSHLVPVMK